MTIGPLDRALRDLPEPAPPPELAAQVMAAIARLEDEPPQPPIAAPEPTARWIPVLPGAVLVLGAYLYGVALAEGVVRPVLAGELLATLPFDPLPLLIATGLLLCLGPLLPGARDRPAS